MGLACKTLLLILIIRDIQLITRMLTREQVHLHDYLWGFLEKRYFAIPRLIQVTAGDCC